MPPRVRQYQEREIVKSEAGHRDRFVDPRGKAVAQVGRGVTDVGSGVANAVRGVAKYDAEERKKIEAEKKKADEAVWQARTTEVLKQKQGIIHDQDTGLYAHKGERAMESQDGFVEHFDKVLAASRENIPERLRADWDQWAEEQRMGFDGVVMRHVSTEGVALQDQNFTTGLGVAADDAVLSSGVAGTNDEVQGGIDRGMKLYDDTAKAHGQKQQFDFAKGKWVAGVLVKSAKTMVANGETVRAKALIDRYRDKANEVMINESGIDQLIKLGDSKEKVTEASRSLMDNVPPPERADELETMRNKGYLDQDEYDAVRKDLIQRVREENALIDAGDHEAAGIIGSQIQRGEIRTVAQLDRSEDFVGVSHRTKHKALKELRATQAKRGGAGPSKKDLYKKVANAATQFVKRATVEAEDVADLEKLRESIDEGVGDFGRLDVADRNQIATGVSKEIERRKRVGRVKVAEFKSAVTQAAIKAGLIPRGGPSGKNKKSQAATLSDLQGDMALWAAQFREENERDPGTRDILKEVAENVTQWKVKDSRNRWNPFSSDDVVFKFQAKEGQVLYESDLKKENDKIRREIAAGSGVLAAEKKTKKERPREVIHNDKAWLVPPGEALVEFTDPADGKKKIITLGKGRVEAFMAQFTDAIVIEGE